MSIKIKTWSEASGGDLHQFIELLGDEKLNEVFYPAPDANPNLTGIFALGYPDHRTHPLHPDYKPKPRFSTGYGLLTPSVELPPEPIDLKNEKWQQDARLEAYWRKIKNHPASVVSG